MIIVTRPNHDQTTNYLKVWSKEIINLAKEKQLSLADLVGKKANKKLFLSYLNKNKINLIFFNGHGDDGCVTGYDNLALVSTTDKQKIVCNLIFSRSCRSGKNLAKYVVKNGTKAFIGYDDDFVFFIDKEKSTKPLQDKTASIFLKPSNLVASSLLKGNSAELADKKSKDMMKRNLSKLLSSKHQADEYMAKFLYNNLIHQIVKGDPMAKIYG